MQNSLTQSLTLPSNCQRHKGVIICLTVTTVGYLLDVFIKVWMPSMWSVLSLLLGASTASLVANVFELACLSSCIVLITGDFFVYCCKLSETYSMHVLAG